MILDHCDRTTLIKSENKIVFHYLPLTLLDLFNQTPDRYKLGYEEYNIPNTKIGNGTQKSVDKET